MGGFTRKPRNKSNPAGIKVETGIDQALAEIVRPLIAGVASSLLHKSSIFRSG